jgi:hypothetical protein
MRSFQGVFSKSKDGGKWLGIWRSFFGLRWQSEAATALFDGTTPPVASIPKRRRASLAAAVQIFRLVTSTPTNFPGWTAFVHVPGVT